MKKIMTLCVLVVLCLGAVACHSQPEQTDSSQIVVKKAETNKKLLAQERFSGQLLDGSAFDSFDYQGVKLVFAFFSYKHRDALLLLKAVEKLKSYENEYNFKIFAVCIDYNQKTEVQKFIADNKIGLPVILEEATLEIAQKFKVENEVSLLGLSSEHKAEFGIKKYVFAQMPDGEGVFLDYMKENLKIRSFQNTKPHLGIEPETPDFTATTFDGRKIKISDYRGRPVLLIFFSPKCPHCQHEMKTLRDILYPEFKTNGFEIIAISVMPLEGEALKLYESFKFVWPVIDDVGGKIHRQFSNERSVPENFLIDKNGRIVYSVTGFSENDVPAYVDFMRMWLRKLLGQDNPPLLSDKHYNGSDTCAICHKAEYVSWSVTPHAHAWETLEIKGKDADLECVACHSLGFKDPKGYATIVDKKTGEEKVYVPANFENVQCESCHSLGGPHLGKDDATDTELLKKKCLTCHTDTFSLHFNFDERIKKADHSNKDAIMKMTEGQRENLLKKVSKSPDELFDSRIKYVGSEKCASCHQKTYDKWLASGHGHTMDDLKKTGKDSDPQCLKCHTVAYGEGSGYLGHMGEKAFENVGCESCHGPGEKHLETKLAKDIRGLGKDCPFCVVQQICMSCHDFANSPEFNINKGLEKIKTEH